MTLPYKGKSGLSKTHRQGAALLGCPLGEILVVEQTHAGEGHDDAVLIALFDDQVIPDGAAGFCDVLDTGSNAALDGVGEGEEGVGAQCNSVTGIQPCTLLLSGQRLGTDGEVVLPDALSADILFVAVDVAVDDVVTTGTTQILAERQVQSLGMLTQEPGIRLTTSQSDATTLRSTKIC